MRAPGRVGAACTCDRPGVRRARGMPDTAWRARLEPLKRLAARRLRAAGVLCLLALLLALPVVSAATPLQGWWRPALDGETAEGVERGPTHWRRFEPARLTRFVEAGQAPETRRSWLLLQPAPGQAWPGSAPVLRVHQGGLQWLSISLPGEPPR